MLRRDFVKGIAASAAWPLTARAQQSMPVIGLLSPRGSGDTPQLLTAFRRGLKDSGFVEGQNVAIEYRFAENRNERLPALAADLVHRQVTVIAATAVQAVAAAKAATASIPIVFEMGDDPVRLGFVAGLDRPGGNITGVSQLNREVGPKRLELLHELLPAARVVALLANPTELLSATLSSKMRAAARTLGLELHVLNASAEGDFEGAFAKLIQLRAGGRDQSRCAFRGPKRTARRAGRPPCCAGYLRKPRIRRGGWLGKLRGQSQRRLPSGRRLCRPYSQG